MIQRAEKTARLWKFSTQLERLSFRDWQMRTMAYSKYTEVFWLIHNQCVWLKPFIQSLYIHTPIVVFRLYVRNFWSHERRLPPATLERMLVVLKSLYSSRIEERFLSLATDLLLEMTSHSPDFTRNMFEFPLSECKFQVESCHCTANTVNVKLDYI